MRLAGKRIATPACALVRNDRPGSAVGLEAAGRFREADGGGKTPALRCRPASAPIPTHPAPNGAPVGRGLAPAGHLRICLAPSPQRIRLPNLSLRGAQRRGNPFPRNANALHRPPGRSCIRANIAPLPGRASLRLAGERIATPACALVRNDRLGGAVGLEAAGRFREADGGGEPPPYGTGFGDASGPTHPAPIMHP